MEAIAHPTGHILPRLPRPMVFRRVTGDPELLQVKLGSFDSHPRDGRLNVGWTLDEKQVERTRFTSRLRCHHQL